MYLGEPPADRDELAVRPGCHVAAGQRAGKRAQRRLELLGQDVGESAFFGFDDCVGVMRDQSAQHGVGLMDFAQVTWTVQSVQARQGKIFDLSPEGLTSPYMDRFPSRTAETARRRPLASAVPPRQSAMSFGTGESDVLALVFPEVEPARGLAGDPVPVQARPGHKDRQRQVPILADEVAAVTS